MEGNQPDIDYKEATVMKFSDIKSGNIGSTNVTALSAYENAGSAYGISTGFTNPSSDDPSIKDDISTNKPTTASLSPSKRDVDKFLGYRNSPRGQYSSDDETEFSLNKKVKAVYEIVDASENLTEEELAEKLRQIERNLSFPEEKGDDNVYDDSQDEDLIVETGDSQDDSSDGVYSSPLPEEVFKSGINQEGPKEESKEKEEEKEVASNQDETSLSKSSSTLQYETTTKVTHETVIINSPSAASITENTPPLSNHQPVIPNLNQSSSSFPTGEFVGKIDDLMKNYNNPEKAAKKKNKVDSRKNNKDPSNPKKKKSFLQQTNQKSPQSSTSGTPQTQDPPHLNDGENNPNNGQTNEEIVQSSKELVLTTICNTKFRMIYNGEELQLNEEDFLNFQLNHANLSPKLTAEQVDILLEKSDVELASCEGSFKSKVKNQIKTRDKDFQYWIGYLEGAKDSQYQKLLGDRDKLVQELSNSLNETKENMAFLKKITNQIYDSQRDFGKQVAKTSKALTNMQCNISSTSTRPVEEDTRGQQVSSQPSSQSLNLTGAQLKLSGAYNSQNSGKTHIPPFTSRGLLSQTEKIDNGNNATSLIIENSNSNPANSSASALLQRKEETSPPVPPPPFQSLSDPNKNPGEKKVENKSAKPKNTAKGPENPSCDTNHTMDSKISNEGFRDKMQLLGAHTTPIDASKKCKELGLTKKTVGYLKKILNQEEWDQFVGCIMHAENKLGFCSSVRFTFLDQVNLISIMTNDIQVINDKDDEHRHRSKKK